MKEQYGNFYFCKEQNEFGHLRKLKFRPHPDFIEFLKGRIEPMFRTYDKEAKQWIIYTDFFDQEILSTAVLLFDRIYTIEDGDYTELFGKP